MSAQEGTQPTAEQVAAAGEVSQAVAAAASAAPTADQARSDAATAARTAAERVNLEITDEQIAAISNGVVNAMEQRGAFDAPLEAVGPPAPGSPPADPSAPASAEAAAAAAPVEAPRKRTFAQRFLGE